MIRAGAGGPAVAQAPTSVCGEEKVWGHGWGGRGIQRGHGIVLSAQTASRVPGLT